MDIESVVKNEKAVILYFWGENCNVCFAIKPKIQEAIKDLNIKFIEINAKEDLQLSAKYNVFSIPTIIVFFEGKEFIRKSRNISIPQFLEEIKRPYDLLFN